MLDQPFQSVCAGRLKTTALGNPQTAPSSNKGPPSAHQVGKILVADLSIRMAVSKRQEHLPFVRVQLGAVVFQEAPELACADVACVPRVKLKEKHI